MQVNLRKIDGIWDEGWVLDKHKISSTFSHYNEHGHPQFDTLRTEVGQATFLLKYRQDWAQAKPLAQALADHIYPRFTNIGLIIPMPASTIRPRQPVDAVAQELGKLVKRPVFGDLLNKAPTGQALKDMTGKQEKLEALGDSFTVNDCIDGDDSWNALLIDDLYDTGASMEKACEALRAYNKIRKVYVATLTWK